MGGLVESHGALAAKIRLKIRHQQSCADSLTGDIPDYQAKSFSTCCKKIVVVSAHLTSLLTDPGIFQGFQNRQILRKQSSLHLLCDVELLGNTALRFASFCRGAPLCLDRMCYLVKAHK